MRRARDLARYNICSSVQSVRADYGRDDKPRSSKIEGINEKEGRGSGGTSRGQIAGELLPEVLLRDALQEQGLEFVLEGEVQGLRGKVPDDVGQIASPETEESGLLWHSDQHIDDSWRNLQ